MFDTLIYSVAKESKTLRWKEENKLNGKGIPSLLTYFLQIKCEINYFVQQYTLPYRDMSTPNKDNKNKLLSAKFS